MLQIFCRPFNVQSLLYSRLSKRGLLSQSLVGSTSKFRYSHSRYDLNACDSECGSNSPPCHTLPTGLDLHMQQMLQTSLAAAVVSNVTGDVNAKIAIISSQIITAMVREACDTHRSTVNSSLDSSSTAIINASYLNKFVHAKCETFCRALSWRYSSYAATSSTQTQSSLRLPLSDLLVSDSDGISVNYKQVNRIIQDHKDSIINNKRIFSDIYKVHKMLIDASDDLSSSSRVSQEASEASSISQVVSETELSKYASAATEMGSKAWVKGGNEWMINTAFTFFRRNGAKRHYISEKMAEKQWWSRDEMVACRDVLEKDLAMDLMVAGADEGHGRGRGAAGLDGSSARADNRIRLLDVGSCYNPLAALTADSPAVFDITALDLFPSPDAVGEVYQCDFLNLSVGDEFKVSAPSSSSLASSFSSSLSPAHRSLLQLQRHSFDCVTMSLVLSYLPSPEMRRQMIERASSLLVRPRASSSRPHHAGLLLIVEKDSIFGGHPHLLHSWKESIRQCGFQLLRYSRVKAAGHSGEVSSQKSHVFAFRRMSEEEEEERLRLSADKVANNASSLKMWIKQDFYEAYGAYADALKTAVSLPLSQDVESQASNVANIEGEGKGNAKTKTSVEAKSNAELGANVGTSTGRGLNDFITRVTAASASTTSSSNSYSSSNVRSSNNRTSSHGSDHIDVSVAAGFGGLKYRSRYPVAIIGGGLGGTALALALQRQGIPVKVFEKDAAFGARKQGYALTIQQASGALRVLGLSDKLVSLGVTSYAHESFDAAGSLLGAYGPLVRCGRVVAEDHFADADGLKSFMSSLTQKNSNRHNVHIPRQALRRMFFEEIDNKSVFQWNKRFVSFGDSNKSSNSKSKAVVSDSDSNSDSIISCTSSNTDSEFVLLRFADGSEQRAALAVSADGIYSTAFGALFPRAPALNCLGLMVVLGISPRLEATSFSVNGQQLRKQSQWLDGSTRVFAMPFDRQRTMWQLSFKLPLHAAAAPQTTNVSVPSSSGAGKYEGFPGPLSGAELKQIALEQCSGWDPVLVAAIRDTDEADISGHPTFDRDPDQCIALLGPDVEPKVGPDVDPGVEPAGGPESAGQQGSSRLQEGGLHDSYEGLGLVTLLGDAVHPMSPFKGQGANQAICDAIDLAKAICDSDLLHAKRRPIRAALRDYEREMLARSSLKVMRSRDSAVYLHSEAALVQGNITRAMAAELFGQQRA